MRGAGILGLLVLRFSGAPRCSAALFGAGDSRRGRMRGRPSPAWAR
ncbi:hypothetical protein STXM2123_1254 [Streptomyces sp. F-3]|nr:hypothetical protein STXM2123_1254 [Streptomyces sp. F-3]